MAKPKTSSSNELATPKPVRLERVSARDTDRPHEKRTLIVHNHNFEWHRIIFAVGFLILVVAAVV